MAAFNPLDILARLRGGATAVNGKNFQNSSGLEETKSEPSKSRISISKRPTQNPPNTNKRIDSFHPVSSGARLSSHGLRVDTTTPDQAHSASPIMQNVQKNLGSTRAFMGSPGIGDGRPTSLGIPAGTESSDSSMDSDGSSIKSRQEIDSSNTRVLLNFGTERSFSNEEIRAKLEGEISRLQRQLSSTRNEVDRLQNERNDAQNELKQYKAKTAAIIKTIRSDLGKMTVKFNNAVAQLSSGSSYRNNRPLSGQTMQPYPIRDASPSKDDTNIAAHLQIASQHTLPGVAPKSFMGPTFSELMRLQGSDNKSGATHTEKRNQRERQHVAKALTTAASNVAANNKTISQSIQNIANNAMNNINSNNSNPNLLNMNISTPVNTQSSGSTGGNMNTSNGASAAAAAVASLVGDSSSGLNIMDLHVADPFQPRPADIDKEQIKKDTEKQKKKEKKEKEKRRNHLDEEKNKSSNKTKKEKKKSTLLEYDEDDLGNFSLKL
jgi:hypothetical protein